MNTRETRIWDLRVNSLVFLSTERANVGNISNPRLALKKSLVVAVISAFPDTWYPFAKLKPSHLTLYPSLDILLYIP